MKLKNTFRTFALVGLFFFPFQSVFSQCFQIESILVDACGGQEGLNEMVRFKVGGTAINTGTLSVTWPNNPWQGLVQNAGTAARVATLNADILDAGGCGQLIEPTGGVLPANATVILVTSFNFDTALNSFGALTDTYYIVFQNNPSTASGHFANSGSGLRTLTMSFGSCTDTVTYDRNLLIDPSGIPVAADGATVLFNPAGTPTYVNYGCSAPVPPFTVEAGSAITACAGTTISLNGSAQGQQSVVWSAPSGNFSNPTGLATNYTIPASATGILILTLTATNSCGATVADQVAINVGGGIVPNFATTLTLCSGSPAPILNTTSPNGITGTWNPATINNTTSGNYIFTPNPNQCANPITLNVTVTNSIIPNFATSLTLCSGSPAPILNTASPNGITGTWNPTTINNTANGNYIFTPNPNQCANPITLNVTVTNSIVPNFATSLTLCSGNSAPILNTTSPNGITGTWNPATINNTANGNYIFTPNPNQCANPITLNVTVTNSIIPNFATSLTLCSGSSAPILNTTSPNGITGTWNPTTINNTASGNYIFTPNPNQCANPITLNVTVTNSIVPNFATTLTLCSGNSVPILNTTSPNGITGTWNPATVNNTANGNYIFTPNPNQCANPITLNVTIETIHFTVTQYCRDGNYWLQANPSLSNATYEWTASGTIVGNEPTLNVSHLIDGQSELVFPLKYTLNVTLSGGCSAATEALVYGTFCNIPKGISPNGDSKNDTFDLTGLGVQQLSIFNRYGTEVFHQAGYTNQWNGQSDSGKELPDATYYYAITLTGGEVKTGWVYLNR